MNGLQVLAGAERAELAVGVAEPERGLALVDAGAEQLELERGLELAERRRRRRSHAEAALPHAGERAVVVPELIRERGQPRHAHGVEPVGIDLFEVVADVEHREAVDLERRLGLGLGLRRAARRLPAARLEPPARARS